ncbi:MAG: glycosyltransferase family 4 protein, partial [Verrucomicrobia bacterium]|nr:glycosyltransferase family 4 protein [Verrucomicrobiota bacterium]
ARRLGSDLGCPVVCMLQGEDDFVDAMGSPFREECWREMSLRAREVHRFIAASVYFGNRMAERLSLSSAQLRVVSNGILLDGYDPSPSAQGASPPVLGFFARMCPEKGLDRLIDAYLLARRDVPGLRLKVGGSCGPGDEPFVGKLRARLSDEGAMESVEFHPNLDRNAKIRFLQSLSFFSVPAQYSEAFGLYLVEAMAAGVPVVQPRHCAFPEIVERSGGGIITENTTEALAEGYVRVASDVEWRRRLSVQAAEGARREFSVEAMARGILQAIAS